MNCAQDHDGNKIRLEWFPSHGHHGDYFGIPDSRFSSSNFASLVHAGFEPNVWNGAVEENYSFKIMESYNHYLGVMLI